MNRQLQFLKKLTVLFSVALLLCFTSVKAQTLNQGDLAVIGWNALTDEVHIVALVDIPAGTVVKITDKGWDNSTNAFIVPPNPATTSDGLVTWTLSSMVPAGTVLELFLGGADDGTTLTNLTTSINLTSDIVSSEFAANDPMILSGDQIFIYQGADNNPFFIFGMNSSNGQVDANNWNNNDPLFALRDSNLPDGDGSQNALTNGINAIGLPGGSGQQDNVQYTGPTATADRNTWLARFTNLDNWSGSNADNITNPITEPSDADDPIVDIGAPNALPTVTGLPASITATEDIMGNLDIASSSFADDDSDEITVTFSVANGVISFSATNIPVTLGGNGTATGTVAGAPSDINNYIHVASNIRYTPSANLNGPAADMLTILANDGDGSGDVSLGTVPINITAVNDAPTITAPANIAVVEDLATSLTGISFADVDAGSGSVTATFSLSAGTLSATSGAGVTVGGTASALTLAGSIADINGFIAASGVTYTPVSNSTVDVTLTVSINDGGNTGTGGAQSAIETIVLDITTVNDAPTVTTSGGAVTFTEPEQGDPVSIAIDDGLTVSDVDNGTLASAVVTITGNFQGSEDVLGFMNNGSTMGNIVGSYNAGTGSLTLTSAGATATLAQWQAALRAVTYSNASSSPNVATRTISFAVSDGTDDSTPTTRLVAVEAVNTAPVMSIPAAIVVNEDAATPLTGISFSDADAGVGLVMAAFSVPAGSLSATSGGGVTVGGTASALTLTGTVEDINAFVASSGVTYTPLPNAAGDVTLTVMINDNGNTGPGGAQQDSGTVTLQIAAVNDAPVITAPATIAADEDVPTPLTGISFADVDAGSNPVTVTFSVGSGTLTAVSGGGVTITGSGTGELTLAGSLADINTFIASSGVTYTTALNATVDATLTVNINDNGNTGSGGAQEDNTTITLEVTAINDAPVNTVPAAQSVDQDGILVFSAGSGNAMSVSDVDAGGGTIRVTLTATNGLLTLSTTTGLSFSVGSGTASGTMTFEGSIADINLALAGLSFAPTSDYNGAASLQIITDDLGLTGSGGNQADTDVINIAVNAINPRVTSVNAASPDGLYKIADVITLTVSFDQSIIVDVIGGLPTLLLETGSVDQEAVYVSGSGSNTLTFHYTVRAGDVSADLDHANTAALALNGATIRNSANQDAVLTLPAVGGANSIAGQHDIVIDGIMPAVTSVAVPADGYHVENDPLDFTVHFSENVTVIETGGTPYLEVIIGTATVQAAYVSGSGSSALVFRYVVQAGDMDTDGIAVSSSLVLDGGTIRDAAGNDALPALNNADPTNNVLVYAVRPNVALSTEAISPVNAPFTLVVAFNEPVTGFTLDDITTTNAAASDLQTADNITFTALVTPAADGEASLSVAADVAQNIAGNGNIASGMLSLTYDGTAPVVTAVDVPADGTYRSGDVLSFTVHYSEDIPMASGSLTLPVTIGTITVQAPLADTTRNSLIFGYTVLAGELDTDGIQIGAGILLNGGALRDDAGNDASLTLTGAGSTDNVLVDAVSPAVTSVSVPADGYYREGDVLTFAVQMNEAVTVNTAGGVPYLEVTVGTATVQATYTGGSGNDPLIFHYTVQADDQDLDGITVGNELMLDGGTIQDAVANNALVVLHGTAPTHGVFVYSVRPTVMLSTEAASPVNRPFTVTATFSEAVTGFMLDDITITNGTLSDLQTSDNSAYTFLVTPAVGGDVQLSVAADIAVNIANNGNDASNTLSVQFSEAITGITLEDGSFVYDGTAKSLAVSGELPVGTSVSYENNSRTDVGTQEVTAIVSGDNYEDLVLTAALTVTAATRSIDFPPIPAKTYGDADFNAGATASTDEEVSYASSDATVAEIRNGQIHITGAGTATITAMVPENSNYSDRPEATQVLTVRKATQTITFDAPLEVYRDAGSIQLDATASSGLPLLLTLDDPEVATLNGSTLDILRLGTVRVTGVQEGNANYEPAEPVTAAIRVVDPASDMPIRIHKAVSPNGDGINEYLIIEAIKDYPENRVTIFNRNGTIVWAASGYNNGATAFRGIGTGQLRVPAGTYFYIAEIKVDGKWKYEKGWFVLRY